MELSIASSTAFFMGVATVLVGSALKLAHMGLGGIPLWNAANALQSIGLVIVSGVLLWSVKTLMGNAETKQVRRYVPPRQGGMKFAELPRTDPETDTAQNGHHSPLGIALGKIDRRPKEVAHMSSDPAQDNNGVPGDEMAFTAHELRHEPERLDGQGSTEHCFAGSNKNE